MSPVNPPATVGRTIDRDTGKPAVTVPLVAKRHVYGHWVVRVANRRQVVGYKLTLALFMAGVSALLVWWNQHGGPYEYVVIAIFITCCHLLGAIFGGLSLLLADDD